MRRHQIVPERNDGKDIGWLWHRGLGMLHYYRSRSGTSLAISHCGLVHEKKALEQPIDIQKCHYCEMIENMRDKDQKESGHAPNFPPSQFALKTMHLDFAAPVLRARSMKESRVSNEPKG